MPTATTVGPADVWTALINAGASPAQAAGIMGNMQAESGLNPESAGLDSNGQWSYGLINWNTGSYPGAKNLVTGNPSADLANQIAFLKQTGGFNAATGANPQTIASNFAHSYERCSACGYQGGSSQLQIRSANASSFWQASQTHNWPQAGTGSGSGAGGSGINISLPVVGQLQILSASQVKTVKAFAFIGTGAVVLVLGMGVLLAGLGGVTPRAVLGGNPAVRAVQAPLRGRSARRQSERRVSEARQKEEIRTEGAVTRAEGRASASRYRTAPAREEPF